MLAAQFDLRAATPEQQHRPEYRIAGDADNQLQRAGPLRHALHRVAADLGLRKQARNLSAHGFFGGPQFIGVAQVQGHAT